MPRIPYPVLTEEQNKEYQKSGLNIAHMMFLMPPKIHAALGMAGRTLLFDSSYDAGLRELIILRVGYLSKCAYEVHQHRAYGRKFGLTDEKIEAALTQSLTTPLSAREQAVLKFADEAIVNVRASDATLAAARQYLVDSEILETLAIIGTYMMIARVIETTAIELDAPGVIVGNPDLKK